MSKFEGSEEDFEGNGMLNVKFTLTDLLCLTVILFIATSAFAYNSCFWGSAVVEAKAEVGLFELFSF